MIPTYTIQRLRSTNDETLGICQVNDRHIWTLEDAWKDNMRNVSCIPAGLYSVELRPSSTLKSLGYDVAYTVVGVPDRSMIRLFHPAYDEDDVEGCIGAGFDIDWKNGAIRNSRKACRWFYDIMQETRGLNPFTLEIKNA